MEKPFQLEAKRHIISPESLAQMKTVREIVTSVHEKFPRLVGASFFGSRIVSREHENSDLDVFLFVDNSDLWVESMEPYFDPATSSFREPTVPRMVCKYNTMPLEYEILKSINSEWDKSEHDTRLSICQIVDICTYATEHDVQVFSEYFLRYGHVSTKNSIPMIVLHILSRFHFGFGNELKGTRKHVLDILKAIPNGEELWKEIITYLKEIERENRHLPTYDRYPTSLTEAYRFFAVE
jgi:hypothetical protein